MMMKFGEFRAPVLLVVRLLTVALVILINASLQTSLYRSTTVKFDDETQGLKRTEQDKERKELDSSSNDLLSSHVTKQTNRQTDKQTNHQNTQTNLHVLGYWIPNKTKPEAQLSIRSFEFLNPSYKLYPLNTSEAERLTDRSSYIPDSVWDEMKVQAKSDVYRTLLLYRHGGVWADASLYCNVPLDSWLDLDADDLFTFRRFDNMEAQNKTGIYPWITSWFLVAPKKAPILKKLVDVISNSKQVYRFTSEYFW